ncbi:MAG: zinc ribbon domain-containing protein [Chloroflexi bacterium]|nr:zinc ribbon domain-containing protein [Chloroflexota bacterium]MCI0580912.1 zinc ribbon domain-containing protein [Chloroflexota bacterium]MCI0645785.1 zinc ribbon domain-containing protein [Chloroflexota bacterium]MCI0725499.1 zinc ribbon domain-containing protein [Chloroflexota bacterium]
MNIVRRCENCGQPALAGDIVCWHCGRQLAGGQEEDGPGKVSVREGWGQASLASLATYGGLTLAVFVAVLWVMSALGRRPLIQVSAGDLPAAGWQMVTDTRETFVVFLPEEWEWLDRSNLNQAAAFDRLVASSDVFQLATYPFNQEAADLELVFVAQRTSSPPLLLVVARSQQLSRLSREEAAHDLQAGDYDVATAGLVENFDKSHAYFEVETPASQALGGTLKCSQQFIPGGSAGLVVSACAPARRFASVKSILTDILATFQRLKLP